MLVKSEIVRYAPAYVVPATDLITSSSSFFSSISDTIECGAIPSVICCRTKLNGKSRRSRVNFWHFFAYFLNPAPGNHSGRCCTATCRQQTKKEKKRKPWTHERGRCSPARHQGRNSWSTSRSPGPRSTQTSHFSAPSRTHTRPS